MSDLIWRDDAIDILDDFESEIELGVSDAYQKYRRKLEMLDAVDRPTGHIIIKCKFPTVRAECSECGKPIDPWDKFCKHCGAKMEVQNE